MDMKTARKAHDLAKRLGVHVVCITGGEPTLHPQFREMVELFSDMPVVSILSNGTFISDEKKTHTMKKLLGRNNVFLQVTSVPEYYKDYEYIISRRKDIEALGKVTFETDAKNIHMHTLGRARGVPEYEALEDKHPYTTTCFSYAVIAHQCTSMEQMIAFAEQSGKFCAPLVDFRGGLHLSESWLCPTFATLDDDFHVISKNCLEWSPCGGCRGIKKALAKRDPSYVRGCTLLGLK